MLHVGASDELIGVGAAIEAHEIHGEAGDDNNDKRYGDGGDGLAAQFGLFFLNSLGGVGLCLFHL